MHVIKGGSRTIDLNGIEDHTVRNLTFVTAGAMARSSRAGQLENFGCKVKDNSQRDAARPMHHHFRRLQNPGRHPLGLLDLCLQPIRYDDWNILPHVPFTAPDEWYSPLPGTPEHLNNGTDDKLLARANSKTP